MTSSFVGDLSSVLRSRGAGEAPAVESSTDEKDITVAIGPGGGPVAAARSHGDAADPSHSEPDVDP